MQRHTHYNKNDLKKDTLDNRDYVILDKIYFKNLDLTKPQYNIMSLKKVLEEDFKNYSKLSFSYKNLSKHIKKLERLKLLKKEKLKKIRGRRNALFLTKKGNFLIEFDQTLKKNRMLYNEQTKSGYKMIDNLKGYLKQNKNEVSLRDKNFKDKFSYFYRYDKNLRKLIFAPSLQKDFDVILKLK